MIEHRGFFSKYEKFSPSCIHFSIFSYLTFFYAQLSYLVVSDSSRLSPHHRPNFFNSKYLNGGNTNSANAAPSHSPKSDPLSPTNFAIGPTYHF